MAYSDRELAEWEFEAWFKEQDLGELEDVRDFVSTHCIQNTYDVPVGEIVECAKMGLLFYLDDKQAAKEVFDYYRKGRITA